MKTSAASFMNLLICISIFLLFGCATDDAIKLQLNENESGQYFIIWTSDTSKFTNDLSKPINFDRNKVVYLNYRLHDSLGIKPLNLKGEDMFKRLKNFMGNEFYMTFYNPTNDEYREHPNWDRYYLDKLPTEEKTRLQSKGYKFEDDIIKQQLIKLGKYRNNN